jgi:hypothetical protein
MIEMRLTFSSNYLTWSRLLTYSGYAFFPTDGSSAGRRETCHQVSASAWLYKYYWWVCRLLPHNSELTYIYLYIITYMLSMLTLKICGPSLLSALLKRVVVFLQPLILEKTCRCSATKESFANAVVQFTLSCVSSRLWKTAVFRTGLIFRMAQCKVDLNLTVSLWMHMHIWSVTMFLRQLFLCPLFN